MAVPSQVTRILQGSSTWNEWRRQHGDVAIELAQVDLSGCGLESINLAGADLTGARFLRTNLAAANLDGAKLVDAEFRGTGLENASLAHATFGGTRFVDVDLHATQGLASTVLVAPSRLDVSTIRLGRGKLDAAFLRGCGLSDAEISFARLYDDGLTSDEITTVVYEIDRARGKAPLQIVPILISYSHRDGDFVGYLEEHLKDHRLRCWRDVRDLVAGRIDQQIDQAIRVNSAVILVLSRHSVNSDWVMWEASRARDAEQQQRRAVLCPVALDNSWLSCDWPGHLRAQIAKYYVMDFSEWRDVKTFRTQTDRLVRGLRTNYTRQGTQPA